MKAIEFLAAALIIGLFSVSPSLGVDEETASPFGEDWPLLGDELDFGDDLVWEIPGDEPSDDNVSGDNVSGEMVSDDTVFGEIFSGEMVSDDTVSVVAVSDDEVSEDQISDEASDGSADVDDWVIDEGFYSDYAGSEGEEFGWGDTIDHPGMPGPQENALWIVFPYSTNVRTTKLVIQKGRYAKELIIPGMDGKLTITELKPDGTRHTYVPDWGVKARRAYHVWFSADSAGDYSVWYEVQNELTGVITRSNIIRYRVFENLAVVVPNECKCRNETATLRALASGCADPRYQWYRGSSTETGEIIVGATSSTYIIRNAQESDAGYYTCNVTCNGYADEDTCQLRVCTRDEGGNECKGRYWTGN